MLVLGRRALIDQDSVIAGPLNHESIDKKGWAFLLPTVTPEDAAKHFPGHHSCKVPSGVDYLRLTDVKDLK